MNTLLISKLVAQLILPPGGLILMGVSGLIFWQKKWGRGLMVLSFILLWLLSTTVIRDMLSRPLEYKYSPLNISHVPADAEAIVLLGGGIYKNAPEYGGVDALSGTSMMRTIYAAKIARKTGLPVYTSGGRPLSNDGMAEGLIMRLQLIQFGVPAAKINIDIASNTTFENAIYIKQMLAQTGIHKVVLVTNAWHMPRAVQSFAAQHIDIIPAPTDYLTYQSAYDLRNYLPQWNVFGSSGVILHEYLGMLWYMLKSW